MAKRFRGSSLVAAILAFAAVPPASAQRAGGAAKAERADFADMATGTYVGEVILDARGASQTRVWITVAKTGPNQVRVASDYPRLPAFTARLARAMDSIQNVGGDAVFLLDLSKRPRTLTVTVDGASWAGSKQ